MTFTSSIFIFAFLPLISIFYMLFRKLSQKNTFLLIASIIFYAFSGIQFTFYLTILVFMNYIVGFLINKTTNKRKLIFLIFGLVVNFGVLFLYKYLTFAVDNFSNLLHLKIQTKNSIIMPIGLSFAVFKLATYLIDLYQRKISVQKNFALLLLYTLLFSTVLSGPIIKYCDIAPQFGNRKTKINDVYNGIKRFIFGFAKKILIANVLGEVSNKTFGNGTILDPTTAWFGILCYSLQLFFDFAGYSDMALGISEVFGFHFKENFNYPYISRNVQEFWQRWHISLSTWFKEYLYIPLGGNKKGVLRTYINLLIVFLITGLWHGANWTFVLWGLFHGFFMMLERIFLKKILQKLPKIFQHIYLLLIITIGWVFFRAENFLSATQYLSKMFTFSSMQPNKLLLLVDNQIMATFVIAIILSTPVYPWLEKIINNYKYNKNTIMIKNTAAIVSNFLIILLFVFSISCFIASDFNSFIYSRF